MFLLQNPLKLFLGKRHKCSNVWQTKRKCKLWKQFPKLCRLFRNFGNSVFSLFHILFLINFTKFYETTLLSFQITAMGYLSCLVAYGIRKRKQLRTSAWINFANNNRVSTALPHWTNAHDSCRVAMKVQKSRGICIFCFGNFQVNNSQRWSCDLIVFFKSRWNTHI